MSLQEYYNLELKVDAGCKLEKSVLNRAHSDMRRIMQMVHAALLKKKDLLLDFASLTQQDIEENFESVNRLYNDLLYYEHVLGSGKVRMGSPYQLESSENAAKSLVQNFETDILEFIKGLMTVDSRYYNLKLSDFAKEFKFDVNKLEVNGGENEKKLEFFSLGGEWGAKKKKVFGFNFDQNGEMAGLDESDKETDSEQEPILIMTNDKLQNGDKYK